MPVSPIASLIRTSSAPLREVLAVIYLLLNEGYL